MKILALADIHNDFKLLEYIKEKTKNTKIDLIILAGDIGVNGRIQKGIFKKIKEIGDEILIIPGNHDFAEEIEFNSMYYNLNNIHGKAFIKYDVAFIGAGGANIGPYFLEDNSIFNLIYTGFSNLNQKDNKHIRKKILITHMHPKDSKIEHLSNFVEGSYAVRKAVDLFKPDLLICGHIHEASGIEEIINNTKVINVSRYAKILDI